MPKNEGTPAHTIRADLGPAPDAPLASIMIELLLLEPDFWRFTGIQHVAERSGQVHVLGERYFEKIMRMKRAPAGVNPTITMLAHRLILDYGIAIIPHLKDLFHGTNVLVYGEDDRLEVMAELLAVGVGGYFLMSSPAIDLFKALQVISEGQIWGPRRAVALWARRSKREVTPSSQSHSAIDELNLLRLLHQGLSNKEIAARLGLAEVTIKARMSRLYRKYGVRTRVQLLAIAMKRALLSA